MYIPLDDELAEDINKGFEGNNDFAQVGLSLGSNTQTTTSPSELPTNMSNTTNTPTNTNCSTTEETFITSTTGFAAIAGVAVACLALLTCAIIACVYLRVKQRAHNRKVKRFVFFNNTHTL